MDHFGEQMNAILMHMYRAVNEVEGASLRSMMNGSLSISEMHMIECIGRGHDDGRNVTDVAREQGITLASATIAIKKLEKKGFVSKERSREDGRKVMVRLTREGRRADVGHRYFHRQMAKALEKNIPQEERGVLLRGFLTMDEFFTRKAEELQLALSESGGDGEK